MRRPATREPGDETVRTQGDEDHGECRPQEPELRKRVRATMVSMVARMGRSLSNSSWGAGPVRGSTEPEGAPDTPPVKDVRLGILVSGLASGFALALADVLTTGTSHSQPAVLVLGFYFGLLLGGACGIVAALLRKPTLAFALVFAIAATFNGSAIILERFVVIGRGAGVGLVLLMSLAAALVLGLPASARAGPRVCAARVGAGGRTARRQVCVELPRGCCCMRAPAARRARRLAREKPHRRSVGGAARVVGSGAARFPAEPARRQGRPSGRDADRG